MKKIIANTLLNVFLAGMIVSLISNSIFQIRTDLSDFREESEEQFWQLEQILGNRIRDRKTIETVFSVIFADREHRFYAVNTETGRIDGSTDRAAVGKTMEELGIQSKQSEEKFVSGYYKDESQWMFYVERKGPFYILVKSCPLKVLHRDVAENASLICIYFVVLFFILLVVIYTFLDRKIVKSLVKQNADFQETGKGNWQALLPKNSSREYRDLVNYMDKMVAEIMDFSGKVSKALELSDLPIGICEYIPETKQLLATSRVKDILGLSDREYADILTHPALLEEKKKSMKREKGFADEEIYSLGGYPERYIRFESFPYKHSTMYLLVDVTKDVGTMLKMEWDRDRDALTGMYNRDAFNRKVDILSKTPEPLKNVLLVFADLDNLKYLNDNYGHSAGDRYLMAMAEVFHLCKNKNKVTGRMGGDEFAMLAYGYDRKEDIMQTVDEIRAFRHTMIWDLELDEKVTLEFSLGYAVYPEEGTNFEDLLKIADQRMYEEKRQRKEQSGKVTR